MLIDPYATTVCKPLQTDKIEKALIRAHIETPLPVVETANGERYPNVRMVTPDESYSQVPSFTQPIRIAAPGMDACWVIDARPYLRVDRRTGGFTYTSHNDFQFQVIRTALHVNSLNDHQAALGRLGDYPIEVFVRWITSSLAVRFNLELQHQIEISVVVAYYYFLLLSEHPEKDHQQRDWYAKRISRITHVPVQQTLEILDRLPLMRNGGDLTQGLQEGSSSLRLKNMRFADLYAVLIMSWVGVNARENVGVALEHLPTFIAMVYSGLQERSYRKTVIATRAERTGKKMVQNTFTMNVMGILDRISER